MRTVHPLTGARCVELAVAASENTPPS
jgi:hypothetical protein